MEKVDVFLSTTDSKKKKTTWWTMKKEDKLLNQGYLYVEHPLSSALSFEDNATMQHLNSRL